MRFTRVGTKLLLLTALTLCSGGTALASPHTIEFPTLLPCRTPGAWLANSSVAVAALDPPADSEVVALARLLGGSTLVPLAQYVSARWVTTWPLPDQELERTLRTVKELPQNWYPVPGGLPTEWFLWTEDLRGVPIRVGTPVLAGAHCQGVWGLSTRLQSFGHETTAIATSVQADVKPFEYRALHESAYPTLRAFLGAKVETSETAALRSRGRDPDALLGSRRDSSRVYELNCVDIAKYDYELSSFEASRRLGSRDPDWRTCDDIVVVQGWYVRSREGFTLLQASSTLTDCDAKELRTPRPLLLLTVDTRRFVIVREHGYEDETFAVLEFRHDRLQQILEVPGGGC